LEIRGPLRCRRGWDEGEEEGKKEEEGIDLESDETHKV